MKNGELFILEIIQNLQDKKLSGKDLEKDDLLDVIEFMRTRGQETFAIAGLLNYSARQIRRFLVELRKRNGFRFRKVFWGEHIGAFIQKQESAQDFLIRAYNDTKHPLAERILACASLLKYSISFTTTLQSLGALPLDCLEAREILYETEKAGISKDEYLEDGAKGSSSEELRRLALLQPLERYQVLLRIKAFYQGLDKDIDEMIKETERRTANGQEPQ